jgi:hypothetical protein
MSTQPTNFSGLADTRADAYDRTKGPEEAKQAGELQSNQGGIKKPTWPILERYKRPHIAPIM